MEYALFVWDNKPNNYLKVCFQSLRLYNKNCKIYLYYKEDSIVEEYNELNINFFKIDIKHYKSPQYYHVYMINKLYEELNENDKLLALDCDLLFQNDPFLLFNDEKSDLYYSRVIMNTPDSLRPEKLWKYIDAPINAGVFGLIINRNSKNLMKFWIDNLHNPSWDKWVNFKMRHKHINKKWWWLDTDFLNCIYFHELPFELNKEIVSYKYNYYVSTWGHYKKELNMGNKIGNSDYAIIHFKANFKDTYNIENPKIYNIENILAKKDLTTKKSRDNIYKKFISRGEKRWNIV